MWRADGVDEERICEARPLPMKLLRSAADGEPAEGTRRPEPPPLNKEEDASVGPTTGGGVSSGSILLFTSFFLTASNISPNLNYQ
jgi:hypothetical protein